MKSYDGYLKRKLGDSYVNLTNGGHKSLGDFLGSILWDATNKKILYKASNASNWSDLLLFGSNAFNSTDYVNVSGDTMTGRLTINRTNTDNGGHIVIKDVTTSNSWPRVIEYFASNIGVGGESSIYIGLSDSARNGGYIGFKYNGSGSTSNFIGIGLHSVDNTLVVNGNGNVGIGTTSPSLKLDVNGDIRSNGFHHLSHDNDDSVLLAGGSYKALSEFKIGDYLPLSGGNMTGNINWTQDAHGIYFYNNCGIEKWSGYGPSLVAENGTTFEISSKTDRSIRYTILHTGNWTDTIDGRYVKCGGDSVSGHYKFIGRVFGDNYRNQGSNVAAFIWDKPGPNYTGVGANGVEDQIYFGACNADSTWVSYKQTWKFNGGIYVDSLNGNTPAYQTYDNNFILHTNEFNFIPDSYNLVVYFNFQSPSRNSSSTVLEYRMYNGKAGYTNVVAANFYTSSDRVKKKNIRKISEHISKFTLKDTNKDAYGVIAQEVPEMFRSGEENNLTVNYNSVLSYYIGLLENKVKELETKIKILENGKNFN